MHSSSSDSTLTQRTRVILLRHGRSTFNQLKLYQGSSDVSVLTEQGYDTARQVGNFLTNQPIDAIYTSPLKRVQQTVDAMLEHLGSGFPMRLEIHQSLREIEMLGWEGRSFQDVQQTEPEAYQCWKQRPHEFRLETPLASPVSPFSSVAVAVQTHCYPVLDLYKRAQQFWQEILPRHCGQTVLIASHGGTNRALISAAIELAPARFHSLQQSNCGISILDFPGGCLNAGHLSSLNLTKAIGETLPKLKEGKQGLRLLLLPAESAAQSVASLSDQLREVAIDFSLTSTSDSAQALTDQVLKQHPQTVQLQSQEHQFLLNWQRTIAAKSSYSSHLITGLVVAQSADIQQILGEAIGLNPLQRWRLQIQPGAVSILHYPAVGYSPVIQALNFP
ncbi:MAG: histidine phosphatase family protein [Pegethrix bostrychoides GSE-TBD4-15B]|jgi:probable phosphoglycerate mutase|uniref:Histidine phosphatase family protein n=1 Tax=Pegethrix bostrychoides GSE-TBD4-15B TaxID=2839662 RepID=A0A951U341_9CYAN|nr:histidine phosphatase family protein [Pegethrix bostrychoides GSE-TBD4-15B]